MSLENHKITTFEDSVSSLPDYPSDAGYTAAMLKAVFDGRTDKEIKQKFNALIDELKNIISELEKADSTAAETAKKYTDTEVTGHNSSESAHSDIRSLISELTRRLNALADSDDTTLDQLSELVAYIKDNRSLIDSVTTAKANKADVYTKGNVDALITAIEESVAELEEKLKKLAATGGGNGVPLISVHDELYSTIVPEDGQVYVVKYHDMPYGEDPNLISPEVFYRLRIGDGVTPLCDIPNVSNIVAGTGNGSAILVDPTYDNGDDGLEAPNNIADGQYSVSFGKYLKNYGKASVLVGYSSDNYAPRAFVAGKDELVNAGATGAFVGGGQHNTVGDGGSYSVTLGSCNTTNSTSVVVGRFLQANNEKQVILGLYNTDDPDALVIIGGGTGNLDRRNALVVKKDGTVVVDGVVIKTNSVEVNIPEGASVVLSDGYIELTGTENDSGNIVFNSIPYGMWTIKATINGKEYEMSVAVDGEEIPIMYFDEVLDNFADNTIDGIITACKTNTIPETWLIGDKKAFTMDDKEYHLVIIGKNADTFTNGKTAPLTFQFEEIHKNCYMYTSGDTVEVTQWEDTRVRTFYNNAKSSNWGKPIFDTFRNAIVPVVKETKLADGTIQITEDKIFVPSYEEMISGGVYYEYFQNVENRIKTLDGAAAIWWTRTPTTTTRKFRVLSATGSYTTGVGTRGVAPTFCLGSEIMLTNAIKIGDTVLSEEELLTIKASAGTADLSGLVTGEELTAAIGDAIAELTAEDVGASPSGHTHDDRYYTETEMDTKLAGKAASEHTHDGRYYSKSEVDNLVSENSGSWTVLADETWSQSANGTAAHVFTIPDLRDYKEFFVALCPGFTTSTNNAWSGWMNVYLTSSSNSDYYQVAYVAVQSYDGSIEGFSKTPTYSIIQYSNGVIIPSQYTSSSMGSYSMVSTPVFTEAITKVKVEMNGASSVREGIHAIVFAR